MRRATPLLLAFLLLGCKGSHENEVVGAWKSPKGIVYSLDAAKTFKMSFHAIVAEGTWSIDGNTVALTQTKINGSPVAELKARLNKSVALTPQLKTTVENLGKPQAFALSLDGKALSKNDATGSLTLTKG